MEINESNLRLINSEMAVRDYEALDQLTPPEQYLFGRYLPAHSRVLDLGVGTGRCTPALSRGAKAYVGLDYSERMIQVCKERFADLDFRVQDAADLSAFESGSFDVVVFSFNGLDFLHPRSQRWQCIQECARVLRPGGRFIFSTHNPRAIVKVPDFKNATALKAIKRIALAAHQTLSVGARHLPTAAFWKGEGYIRNPVHGGIATFYFATPARVLESSHTFGLEAVEVVGCYHPRETQALATPAYYYVLEKK